MNEIVNVAVDVAVPLLSPSLGTSLRYVRGFMEKLQDKETVHNEVTYFFLN